MISGVDIEDWQESVEDGYRDYIKKTDMNEAMSFDIWKAATHWAFEYMWARQEQSRSAWRKRQIMEDDND